MGHETRMTPVETVTTAGAGAAITVPWWQVNADMPHVLQYLGAAWLITQMVALVYRTWFKKDK